MLLGGLALFAAESSHPEILPYVPGIVLGTFVAVHILDVCLSEPVIIRGSPSRCAACLDNEKMQPWDGEDKNHPYQTRFSYARYPSDAPAVKCKLGMLSLCRAFSMYGVLVAGVACVGDSLDWPSGTYSIAWSLLQDANGTATREIPVGDDSCRTANDGVCTERANPNYQEPYTSYDDCPWNTDATDCAAVLDMADAESIIGDSISFAVCAVLMVCSWAYRPKASGPMLQAFGATAPETSGRLSQRLFNDPTDRQVHGASLGRCPCP